MASLNSILQSNCEMALPPFSDQASSSAIPSHAVTNIPLQFCESLPIRLPDPKTPLPSKQRYIAACTGITLLSALTISAIALLIVHHGSLSSHSLLNDELALLPKICGGMAAASMIAIMTGYCLYRNRSQEHTLETFTLHQKHIVGDL
ncbi:MAG: hypothetical protein JSS62_04135 [Verrucomicrobia bacterium]|nr:hypothetical protein [Verrucomicrobiota bacterium]MBS0645499.1 hypothetical protein [Verrucomicrobiota bacterium]